MTQATVSQAMDSVLRELGWRGRYQMLQAIQYLLCNLPVAFLVMSIVFIGRNIDHKCRELDNSTDLSNVTYGECSVTLVTNMSGLDTIVPCPIGHQFAEPQDRSIVSEWDLVCDREFLSDVPQTLIMLGMCIGAILFTSLADKYGRKPLHVGCHLGILVLGIVNAFVPNFESFLVVRFLLGACHQGTGLTSRILLMELMPAENRRATSVCASSLYTVGTLVLAGIAFLMKDLPWRYLQLVLTGFSAYAVLQICFTDESLRWLTANGKVEEAERILVKAAAMNRVKKSDILDIFRHKVVNKVQRQSKIYKPSEQNSTESTSPEIKSSIMDFFSNRHILLCLAINAIIWAVNALTFFGLAMTSGTLANNIYVGFALNTVVDLPGGLVFFLMIDRIGRRQCCMVFHFLAGMSLLASVLLSSLGGGSESVQVMVTVLTLIGKFAIGITFSTIMLYTPEQFPTNLRNLSLGMASVAGRIGGMLSPYARTLARHVPWLPGTVFGICCIVISILVRLLPETSGRELPQTIDDMIKQHASNAKTSKGDNCSAVNASSPSTENQDEENRTNNSYPKETTVLRTS